MDVFKWGTMPPTDVLWFSTAGNSDVFPPCAVAYDALVMGAVKRMARSIEARVFNA